MAIKGKNLEKELTRELLAELDAIADGLKSKDNLRTIGVGIVAEMKNMIAVGVSPIEGAGRFPEYKVMSVRKNAQNEIKSARADRAATKAKAAKAKKITKRIRLAAKATRFVGKLTKSKRVRTFTKDLSRRGKQSALKSKLLNSQARRQQSGIRAKTQAKKEIRGYPFTVQKNFPNKKPRPVNLLLSGQFLEALKALVSGSETNAKLEIGFEDSDEKNNQIEEGHRIGWLGQGKRPIIPQEGEKFAQRIQRAAEKIMGQIIATKLLTRRR